MHGDEQADTQDHGGVEQAVYAYAREDLDWWVEQLGLELPNGTFGENLTTAGLDVSGALLGETWRVGTAVVQVRSVRIPCGVSRAGWARVRGPARLGQAVRRGRPARRLPQGAHRGDRRARDPVEVLHRPAASVTVAEAMRAFYGDTDLMRRLMAVPDRDPKWDDVAAEMLSRRRTAGWLTMPGALPAGEPVPADGRCPTARWPGWRNRRSASMCTCRSADPVRVLRLQHLHRRRAGRRGVPGHLPRPGRGRDPAGPAGAGRRTARRCSTVFFGGGTPTLLPPGELGGMLRVIDGEFGLAPGAEVTTEANPETVDQRSLAALRAAGITRISLGMQSAAPHVLAVLDRVHQPGRPAQCARWARQAGFEHVSLDLIYGTPGESDADWRGVAGGRAGGRPGPHLRVRADRRGGHPAGRPDQPRRDPEPDDEAMAERYLTADAVLAARGLGWYEVSNWAAGPEAALPAQPAVLDRRRLVGRSGRGRTATSAAPAGGTSSIRPPTRRGSAREPAPATPARC